MPNALRRNPARVALALTVFVTALGSIFGAHWYVARRLVVDPGVPEPFRTAAFVAIAILGVGMIVQFPLERVLHPPWVRIVSFPLVTWMGVLWIAFNTLWISDLGLWLMGASGGPGHELVSAWRAGLVGAGIVAASLLALRNGLRIPTVKRVEIALARWPEALDGFRIAQISDIHIGPVLGRGFAAGLVERVNALDADIVAVTGDLVDGGVHQLRDEVAPFAELRGRQGVFFVTGNHDVYSGDEPWVAHLKELGWIVLRNERMPFGGPGADGFDLAGVDDHRGNWVEGTSEDLDGALAGADPERALVLLAHDPSTFKRARGRIDLQISGHTHGGQIWPFGYLVRAAVPWVAGLYEEQRSQLYVSRGTGFWGPPMRLFAPAEITEIVLRRSA
jgi:predicted MPP superfamily phosphohydrolase